MKNLSLTLLVLGLLAPATEASPLRALHKHRQPAPSRACANFSGTWTPVQSPMPAQTFTLTQVGCEALFSAEDGLGLALDATTTMTVTADEAPTGGPNGNFTAMFHAGWDRTRETITLTGAQPLNDGGTSPFFLSKTSLQLRNGHLFVTYTLPDGQAQVEEYEKAP